MAEITAAFRPVQSASTEWRGASLHSSKISLKKVLTRCSILIQAENFVILLSCSVELCVPKGDDGDPSVHSVEELWMDYSVGLSGYEQTMKHDKTGLPDFR
jgi:hypothetical protein